MKKTADPIPASVEPRYVAQEINNLFSVEPAIESAIGENGSFPPTFSHMEACHGRQRKHQESATSYVESEVKAAEQAESTKANRRHWTPGQAGGWRKVRHRLRRPGQASVGVG